MSREGTGELCTIVFVNGDKSIIRTEMEDKLRDTVRYCEKHL